MFKDNIQQYVRKVVDVGSGTEIELPLFQLGWVKDV
jgi:hypothetical protein